MNRLPFEATERLRVNNTKRVSPFLISTALNVMLLAVAGPFVPSGAKLATFTFILAYTITGLAQRSILRRQDASFNNAVLARCQWQWHSQFTSSSWVCNWRSRDPNRKQIVDNSQDLSPVIKTPELLKTRFFANGQLDPATLELILDEEPAGLIFAYYRLAYIWIFELRGAPLTDNGITPKLRDNITSLRIKYLNVEPSVALQATAYSIFSFEKEPDGTLFEGETFDKWKKILEQLPDAESKARNTKLEATRNLSENEKAICSELRRLSYSLSQGNIGLSKSIGEASRFWIEQRSKESTNIVNVSR